MTKTDQRQSAVSPRLTGLSGLAGRDLQLVYRIALKQLVPAEDSNLWIDCDESESAK